MFVIIGWIVALSAVFGVFIAHGGNIAVVLHALPFEMAAIGGAALGAFIANNQPKVLKATMKGLGQCFKGSKYTKARYMELMALMYDILQKARKEGLMAIEKDVEEPHSSPLFQKYPAVGNDHHASVARRIRSAAGTHAIATAAAPKEGQAPGKPMTFLQAALFQWVNPKGWTMALTAVSAYATGDVWSYVLVALVFGIVNLPSVSVWTAMGVQMRRFLNNPRAMRAFNIGAALLLMGSLYPVAFGH